MGNLVPEEKIENRILLIRGQKVMVDRDLAELYKVPTKALKQAVKRNIERFPADFMFELNKEELRNWRSQFVTSNSDKMGLRYRPYVFTEQGVAMLSSVLKSKNAIQVNIAIMRAFAKLRQILTNHKELVQKLDDLERKVSNHDTDIQGIFQVIRKLIAPPKKAKRKIGFVV